MFLKLLKPLILLIFFNIYLFTLKTVCSESEAVIQMSLFSFDEEYEVVVIGELKNYNIFSVYKNIICYNHYFVV